MPKLMKIAVKVKYSHFDRLFCLHQILTDPVRKAELQQDMYNLVKGTDMMFMDASKSMSVIDLTADSLESAATAAGTVVLVEESSDVNDVNQESEPFSDSDSDGGGNGMFEQYDDDIEPFLHVFVVVEQLVV